MFPRNCSTFSRWSYWGDQQSVDPAGYWSRPWEALGSPACCFGSQRLGVAFSRLRHQKKYTVRIENYLWSKKHNRDQEKHERRKEASKEGKGREGKRREGKGREGKEGRKGGREGRKGKGREGKGREGKEGRKEGRKEGENPGWTTYQFLGCTLVNETHSSKTQQHIYGRSFFIFTMQQIARKSPHVLQITYACSQMQQLAIFFWSPISFDPAYEWRNLCPLHIWLPFILFLMRNLLSFDPLGYFFLIPSIFLGSFSPFSQDLDSAVVSRVSYFVLPVHSNCQLNFSPIPICGDAGASMAPQASWRAGHHAGWGGVLWRISGLVAKEHHGGLGKKQ